ncbi:gypsy retrotransposon integrase-like protein 1 [Plakobranchus ocellatus]|uniref:Gypsy retrotransposon integrase-like protein 1 n=1 Tax=Plakobranchus ocellatus TaxID=259542 RepID=A0AAV3ZWW9_9GAST|nr:gypsy retrotransposon integrase-like protein 1 [Plakobranchus ocellatus]
MEEIVKQADLLGYRGEKREEYLKQEFKLLAERPEKKEEAERQAREKKEEAEHQAREKKEEADRKERIDNTALLAEKAVISLRTPFLRGEVKALCIPDAICDVIVGNVEGARSPENPDMSVMVGAATTRAQANREAVTKPLRMPDIERHVGVDREQLIKLQQEDPRILALVDAGRTSRRGGKIVTFEKARGIVYRRYQDFGPNVDVTQVVLPKPLREYVMSVAHDSITGAHLGIRRTKDKVLSNFYWPGVDGDVTRYCRSCDVCRRTVKKSTVPRVPLEKAQGRQKRYYDRTAKRGKFSVGEKVLVLLPTDSNKLLISGRGRLKL